MKAKHQKHSWAWQIFHAYHTKAPISIEKAGWSANPLQFNIEGVVDKPQRVAGEKRSFTVADIESCCEQGMKPVEAMRQLEIPIQLVAQVQAVYKLLPSRISASEYRPPDVDLSRCLQHHHLIKEWNKSAQVLIIWGPSGLGKSGYAQSLGVNPFVIQCREDLRSFEEDKHDLIICDDVDFSGPKWTWSQIIAFLSIPSMRTKHEARYNNIDQPRCPVVITSNIPPFFLPGSDMCMFSNIHNKEHQNALERRIHVVNITSPLF